jgi:ribose transport system ATP-binding protein
VVPESTGALVIMSGIPKRFGGVLACDDVELSVRPGEVRALLGENGAQALMNALAGVITDHEGTITVAGRECWFPRGTRRPAGRAVPGSGTQKHPGARSAERTHTP